MFYKIAIGNIRIRQAILIDFNIIIEIQESAHFLNELCDIFMQILCNILFLMPSFAKSTFFHPVWKLWLQNQLWRFNDFPWHCISGNVSSASLSNIFNFRNYSIFEFYSLPVSSCRKGELKEWKVAFQIAKKTFYKFLGYD